MSLSLLGARGAAVVTLTLAATIGAMLPTLAAAPAAAAEGSAFTGYTDKTALRDAGRAVVQSGTLAVTDGTAPAGAGKSYYVDSVAGDDAAAGDAPGSAWKSLAKVNATTFQPGDRILLKAGSVWTASGSAVAREAYDYTTWSGGVATDVTAPAPTALLAPKGSGTAENPIVLSSFGTGPAPELDARGVVNDALQLTDQQHWDISQLEISNVTDGFDATHFAPAANNGQVPGEENPAQGDLRGIHIQGENAGTLSGFDIHGVYVHDVSGVTWSVSGAGLDRSKRTGGILFEGLKGDGRTVSQFDDVTVRDNVIANTSFGNLVFKQFSGMGTNRYQDLPPGWGDRAAAKAAADGTITEDPDWRPHTHVEVSGNYLTNAGTQYGWDAMYLTSVRGATVEGNVIDGAGVSGIEMYYSDDVVVQNNDVGKLAGRTGAADSNGIDPDRGTSNILVQGNDIHESGEGVLLCGFSFGTSVVRYNIIRDVARNYVNPHGDSGVNVIYNNLMYNTVAPVSANTVGFFESSGSASTYLVAKNPHYVLDNVFVNTRTDVSGAAFRTGFPGVRFDSNAYFGPGVVAPTTADVHAIVTDPLLGGDPAADLRNAVPASALSPLIGSGAAVDLSAIAPGFHSSGNSSQSRLAATVDFFGRSVQTPPSVGPASYSPAAGHGLITGVVTDADGLVVGGASVSYGAGTAVADAGGRYVVDAPAGTLTLVPSATGYADGTPVTVSLADGQTVGQPLRLGATTATTGTIAGTVSSAGVAVADAAITVARNGAVVATGTTGADGVFRVADVPMGTGYSVSADKTGFQTATQPDVAVAAARTVTVSLVLQHTAAPTHYAIDETFDGEPTGAFTQSGDGVLKSVLSPTGTVAIVDDPAVPGNKYLRIDKSSSSSGTLGVYTANPQNLTGTVTIEARIQRTTTNGVPNQLGMYSYAASSWLPANPAGSTNPAATFALSGGNIITHNVTGASTTKVVAPYKVGQWYTVRNVVDLDTGTFDFYVDDMAVPVLADQPLRTKVPSLDDFLFFINGSNVGDMLVDYFRVNTGTPYGHADTSLAAVGASSGGADVALAPSADGTTWSGGVDPFADAATVTASVTSGFSTVSINGTDVGTGGSVNVPLAGGTPDSAVLVTDVPVVVTAEDGSQKTYTVSLSRTNPSQLSVLRDVSVDGYALTPAFSPGVGGTDDPYVVTDPLASDVPSVTLTLQRGWEGQDVQVNGQPLAAGATQATVDLVDGDNAIVITADSYAGDVSTYVVVVTRTPAPRPVSVDVAASVVKNSGSGNTLTVVITESMSDGTSREHSGTFDIANNAADVYSVGAYRVYVDTKGNTVIRTARIVT
ncbi:carboxypeptidase regulatory-like domain-containing protein [Microbacterium sp. 22242]|uniref:carboxypeptidase regulatory-like domain-containing protein n=1 Tax=Microbacterium sp. 22242 TaxID=3453896 RepID=UPI003F85B06F